MSRRLVVPFLNVLYQVPDGFDIRSWLRFGSSPGAARVAQTSHTLDIVPISGLKHLHIPNMRARPAYRKEHLCIGSLPQMKGEDVDPPYGDCGGLARHAPLQPLG